MFYDMDGVFIGQEISKEKFIEETKKETIIEIWNDVFMEYEKKDGKVIGKLNQKNVDTGAGLERMTAVMQGVRTAYDTDIFKDVINLIKEKSENYNEKYARVVADHLRTSLFMVADGVIPSNKDRGYILRRLIRRATVRSLKLKFSGAVSLDVVSFFVQKYKIIYPEVSVEKNKNIITEEIVKFQKTVEDGIKEFEKGVDPFILATTYGFPIELTLELAKEKGTEIDLEDFKKKMAEHQKLSATASAGMFKGGLANHNEKTVRLHTAHHLLLAGLQQIVDKTIKQRGSNITEERLRIDFLCDHKLTDEEKKKVEDFVNEKIALGLNVIRREMPFVEAEKLGAEMEFGAKYPEVVSVYFIENENGNPISKEFCGGPHVTNTKELGKFKILKEEAVASGIRRIKAVLE
jgi:alanyl-tRNA synthetase